MLTRLLALSGFYPEVAVYGIEQWMLTGLASLTGESDFDLRNDPWIRSYARALARASFDRTSQPGASRPRRSERELRAVDRQDEAPNRCAHGAERSP